MKFQINKYHKFLAFFTFVLYVISLYYLHFIRYKQKVGAVQSWFSINQRPIFWIMSVALFCSFLVVMMVYFYTLDKKFAKITAFFYVILFLIGGFLFLIEKGAKIDILPDRLNNIMENLLFTPFSLVIILISFQIYKNKPN